MRGKQVEEERVSEYSCKWKYETAQVASEERTTYLVHCAAPEAFSSRRLCGAPREVSSVVCVR